MKTTIYTFVNQRPVLHEIPRFFVVQNQADLHACINYLLTIDVVRSPCAITFPAVLETISGHGPHLQLITWDDYRTKLMIAEAALTQELQAFNAAQPQCPLISPLTLNPTT